MLFTAEHDMFRSSLREFVDNEINPHADDWEREGMFPAHELFPKLGQLGVFGLEYETVFGGMGADHSWTVVYGEELGRCSTGGVSMACSVQSDMATPSLARFGSPDLKERYLAPAIRGEMVAAIAVTEPDAGSDVAGLRTRAVRDGDEWIINGTKIYITSGVQGDWLCLLARTSDEGGYRGMSQIIVPTATSGLSVSRKLDKLGQRSSDTAELSLVDVRVPVSNTIGEIGRGFQQQMAQFQNERLIASYMAVGQMAEALRKTGDYLQQRQAFGRPLIDNQYLQFRLAELVADVDMLRHYNYACAEAIISEADQVTITKMASIAKLKAGRLSREVADTCIQFHGGIGYMEETWTARLFRDSRLVSIGGGADEVMLRIIAGLEGWGKL